ncbi:MAG: hypothetical protein GY846_16960 [Deltaproteobacteria bacterium]|nr:hypothetical protein [Deltaproteobacteria bacterium]
MEFMTHKIARLFLSTMILMLLTAFFGDISRAEDPDFTKVHDILHGQRNIGRADDLVVARPVHASGGTTTAKNLICTLGAGAWKTSWAKNDWPSKCYASENPYWPYPQQTRIARLFEQKNDVLFTIKPLAAASGKGCTGTANMIIMAHDILASWIPFSIANFTLSPVQWLTAAVADFNMDGFDDVLVMNMEKAAVATAKDVKKPQDGLMFGPWIETARYEDLMLAPLCEPTVGDFNADGLLDLAWIGAWLGPHRTGADESVRYSQLQVLFATVCPGRVPGTICEEADPLEIILNPLSAQPIPLPATILTDVNCMIPANALATGDYLPGPGDELLLTYTEIDISAPPYGRPLVGELYQFDDRMKPDLVDKTVFFQHPTAYPENVYAVSAPLKGFNRSDQAVVAWNCSLQDGVKPPDYSTSMAVVTFDEGSSPVMERWMSVDYENRGRAHLSGLAVDRFKDLPTGVAPISDYDLNIAVMFGPDNVTCENGIGNHVNFISVGNGPDDYRPYGGVPKLPDFTFSCAGAYDEQSPSAGNRSGSRLRSGDLRGRSVRVGEPLVARISSHAQPQVIVGSPPMHVDYVKPNPQTAKKTDVINFSALWKSFNSVYDIDMTTTKKFTNQNTTGYTHAYTESVGSELKFKIPYIGGPDSKEKQTWKQLYENSVKRTYDTYESVGLNASTATGFGDLVWYMSSRLNAYFYPVLGKRVCPADKTHCEDEEKKPYYLVVSGPDNISFNTIDGRLLEWYNPIHMPGNIFSYPATLEQLKHRISDPRLLTQQKQKSFFTDSSTRTVKVNWSKGSGADISSGSSSTHSFDTDSSVTWGSVNLANLENGASVTGSFNYNSSDATNTLFTTSTALAASTGIAVHKPDGFLTPSLYAYKVTLAIFGQALPEGVLQDMSTPTDVQTHGALQALYAADPTDHAAGSWWSSHEAWYNQHMDLALNHPVRWEPGPNGSDLACLGGNECVSFNAPDPDEVWTSGFYHMRGLLVTVGGHSGPQRARAEEGQHVFLRARIYNLSLKDMDPGTEIHVRFYRQEWNPDNTPKGDSVLISEQVISRPLPGFNTLSNNWTEAFTHFDTTGLGDTQWLFWVVVWAEDGEGKLATEVPAHGLATVADKEDWKWITDVPLEKVTFEGEKTSFSNNVGVLKQAFYIEKKTNEANPNNGDVAVEAVTATPIGFSHNTPVEFLVAAEVVSYDGDAANGVTVEFYDGDPDEAGVLFDVENIAHLRRNEVNHVRIRYRPLALGPQQIIVLARHGSETARGEVTFEALPMHR